MAGNRRRDRQEEPSVGGEGSDSHLLGVTCLGPGRGGGAVVMPSWGKTEAGDAAAGPGRLCGGQAPRLAAV